FLGTRRPALHGSQDHAPARPIKLTVIRPGRAANNIFKALVALLFIIVENNQRHCRLFFQIFVSSLSNFGRATSRRCLLSSTKRTGRSLKETPQPKLSGHKAPGSARLPRPCCSASYQTGRHQARLSCRPRPFGELTRDSGQVK